MNVLHDLGIDTLIVLYASAQFLYAFAFLTQGYFSVLPANRVDMKKLGNLSRAEYPFIVLFYPVLNELEATMRTTFVALSRLDYPHDKYRVIATPNSNDTATTESLFRLQRDFPFVEIMEVPPTSDASWDVVWRAWEDCPKAYWWHAGRRATSRDLPPKKTRQLIYALYHTVRERGLQNDFLVNYIDADSAPPQDHFLAAAAGMQDYDVLQSENIAGNLNQTIAASWHAFDHMAWDGFTYEHLSANGRHPYWVLGKGLFYRASDLVALGSFHPWIAIEDPEVGMRFWANGKRLGIIKNPLIEEVPITFLHGITQRKRWVAGFFQSLSYPLARMGMGFWDRFRARLNLVPCASLLINVFGIPTGAWALWTYLDGTSPLPFWLFWLAVFNLTSLILLLFAVYWHTWKRTSLVLNSRWKRAWYMLRVNPLFLMVWWLIWSIPLLIGFGMFVRDRGLAWDRTEKIDANAVLVRARTR